MFFFYGNILLNYTLNDVKRMKNIKKENSMPKHFHTSIQDNSSVEIFMFEILCKKLKGNSKMRIHNICSTKIFIIFFFKKLNQR